MGVLARILGRRAGRLRGVTAETAVAAEDEPRIAAPPPTAGTPRLERPHDTPSMRVGGAGRTAGTPEHRFPGGTPSTERLHNPGRPGR
jgi:hypothetical protein